MQPRKRDVRERRAYYRRLKQDPSRYAHYKARHNRDYQNRKTSLKKQCFEAYGGCKCAWSKCKVKDLDMLSLDHVYNDGKVERTRLRHNGRGTNFYMWLRKQGYPDRHRYQVLCFNHQMKKELARRRSLALVQKGA